MFEKILAVLATFTIGVISSGGYVGIALLMAIESACIPLPSEIIMPFAGYLVSTGRFDLYLAATWLSGICHVPIPSWGMVRPSLSVRSVIRLQQTGARRVPIDRPRRLPQIAGPCSKRFWRSSPPSRSG